MTISPPPVAETQKDERTCTCAFHVSGIAGLVYLRKLEVWVISTISWRPRTYMSAVPSPFLVSHSGMSCEHRKLPVFQEPTLIPSWRGDRYSGRRESIRRAAYVCASWCSSGCGGPELEAGCCSSSSPSQEPGIDVIVGWVHCEICGVRLLWDGMSSA